VNRKGANESPNSPLVLKINDAKGYEEMGPLTEGHDCITVLRAALQLALLGTW